jgi:hypothetical protein
LAHRQSDPHPSASIAESVRGALQSLYQAPAGFTSPTQIEPGHISLPKRAHPARQAHQPLGPETASRPQAGLLMPGGGAESTGRSRHQYPGGPSTLKRHPPPQITRRASALTAGGVGIRGWPPTPGGQSRRNRGPSPSSRFRGVKAQTRNSTAEPRRTGFAYRFNSSPKSHQPPDQTPLDCSHLVSAHPPCSRKGPLLPARGQKCPRRVKRETTNSRFLRFKGTWPNFGWASTDRKRPWGAGACRSDLRPFVPSQQSRTLAS